jgi:hypothetical protein
MDFEALKLEAARHIHRELGESVRFHYQEGHTVDICVVFTTAEVQVTMGGEVPIDSRQPMCRIRRTDVTRKPRQGDMITRRNMTYEIKSAVPKLDAAFHCLLWEVDDRNAREVRDRT